MQIHELTQPKQEQLDELVGGLARMAGQAIAKSPVGQAVGAAKQAFQKSAVGQTLQKAGDLERQAKISAQTQALAKNTLQTWNDRVIRLTQAAGGFPVDETTYRNNLNDFVQKVMLGNQPINSLDASSRPKITSAIDAVVTDRSDRARMQTAFNNLVTQATVARTGASTAGQSMQPAAQNQPSPKSQPGSAIPVGTNAVASDGNTYQWLGAQWGKVNPATGKAGAIATKSIADELNQAAAGGVATPAAVPGATPKAGGTGWGFNPHTGKPFSSAAERAAFDASPEAKMSTADVEKAAAVTASTGGPAQTSQAKNFLSSLISKSQQQGLAQYLQGATVASTKNPDVDGFLNALGVKTR